MDRLLKDLRFALRVVRREPVFTAVAVLTLAIGTAANLAVFNFASALLFAPAPGAEPHRLLRLCGQQLEARAAGGCDVLSYQNIMDAGARARSLAGVAAHRRVTARIGDPPTETVSVELVSGAYFELLGLPVGRGRLLSAADDVQPGAHPVVVVSHEWWQRRMNADPSAISRTVHLAGAPYEVVGVAPPGFRGAYDAFSASFWVPLSMHQQIRPRGIERTSRGWAGSLLPALRAAAADPASTLRGESGTATASGTLRWHAALIVAQVMLSTVLLGSALVLLQGVATARSFDPGFPTSGLLLVEFAGDPGQIPADAYRRAQESVSRLPEVTDAAYSLVIPLGDIEESRGVKTRPDEERFVSVDADDVGPWYFAVMGIPVVSGRDFQEADAAGPRVAVVNETMARRFFPQGAVGQTLFLGEATAEVVGVARDIKYRSLGETPIPHLYLGPGPAVTPGSALHVRVRPGVDAAGAVRAAVGAADTRVLVSVQSFDQLRAAGLAPRRTLARAALACGALALALTATGLLGVMAYAVARRTREIGIRLALGALATDVRRMVLLRAAALAVAGLVPGTLIAWSASRALSHRLLGFANGADHVPDPVGARPRHGGRRVLAARPLGEPRGSCRSPAPGLTRVAA